jgi:cytochrome c553
MNKPLVLTALFTLSTMSGAALAVGDAEAGKAKSVMCAGCHGADGNSLNPEWPKLAGQSTRYLVKQLQEFKSGKRENATMAPMAAGLTDEDMENLAAFYASQAVTMGSADETQVDLGQKIYRGGNPATGVSACIGCHGPTGAGNPEALFPSLSGQFGTYVENQLQQFRSGQRNNDAGKMMRNTASSMTDAEIKAVSSYVQGLH